MGYPFPSAAWVEAVVAVLNQDERYARVASAWEGDIVFEVFPGPPGKDGQTADRIYLDLWHGKCRRRRRPTSGLHDVGLPRPFAADPLR